MIGRQVGFYLLPEDEAALLLRIDELGPFTPFRMVDVIEPEPVDWPPLPAHRGKRPYEISLVLRPPVGKKPKWELWGNHWVCDHFDGEVLEFERSELIDRRTLAHGPKPRVPFLVAGRFWFQPITDSGKSKSPKFIQWADSVLRCTRKHLNRLDRNVFVGEHSLAAMRSRNIELR